MRAPAQLVFPILRGAGVRDEVEVTDYYEAGLMQYLGYPCIRCVVSGQEYSWTFRIKQFDAEFVKQDFQNPATSVLLLGYIKALNSVASFRNQARRSLDGMWRSEKYASK
jgi:hypothetical protein